MTNDELIQAAEKLCRESHSDETDQFCRQVLASEPRHPEALHLRGLILQRRGENAAAVEMFKQAIAINPNLVGYHNNLGVALQSLGRLEEAEAAYRQALQIKPNLVHLRRNLNNVLKLLGRSPIDPGQAVPLDEAEAINDHGIVLYKQGLLEQSLKAFAKAIALRPSLAPVWNNIGNVHRHLGDLDRAIYSYRRAIAIRVDYPDAHQGLGMALLQSGDFANGWYEYEWRWKVGTAKLREFPQPRWCGEDPAGKTIFVHEEQGFGDAIQFFRYATLLAERGARIICGCNKELVRLLSEMPGVSQVITGGHRLPPFDLHAPTMSMPLFFDTRVETVPARVPYFNIAPDRIAQWKDRVGTGRELKVGLTWAGNPELATDTIRSIPLKGFAPLGRIGNVAFHSLQIKPVAPDECPELKLRDHSSLLTDFAETAALICNLDLVISVDTSVAHLAGALARPVWLLLPCAPDWRWMMKREDSPWYPTMRLFRQPTLGDWPTVMQNVAQALETLAKTGKGAAPAKHPIQIPTQTPPAMPAADPGIDETFASAQRLHQAGAVAQAEQLYRKILTRQPNHAGALHYLGVIANQQGRHDAAADLIRRAVSLRPDYPEAFVNLGTALQAAGRFEPAIASFRQAIALRPHFPEAQRCLVLALSNHGNALREKEQLAEAIAACRAALALDPNFEGAQNNLGVALWKNGQPQEAIAAYRRAIAIRPEFSEAHINLAYALMATGELVEGWREYEWRWKCKDFPTRPRNFAQPAWDGQPLGGATLLIHAEQGLGDTLQFIRYLPMLAGKGGRVIVECQPDLLRLIKPLAGDIPVIARGDTLPAFDVHCPLMSLPRVFSASLQTIPAQSPYLHADAAISDKWRQRLSGNFLKVGLAWAGSPIHGNDANRSMQLSSLAPLSRVPNVQFHSLQKSGSGQSGTPLPDGPAPIDWSADLTDFAETAGLIANLDLVIAVDTAVAHLAGALGKPVWLLLPWAADWRWLMDRADSPWYPTARLFRQSSPGDWAGVVTRVGEALTEFGKP